MRDFNARVGKEEDSQMVGRFGEEDNRNRLKEVWGRRNKQWE
jgi:hypothetical protein